MNAPHVVTEVANEAVIVTVIPGERGNGSERVHRLGHAHNRPPHDQHQGHGPAHQQQSSVIKKRNGVVDKVAQPARTELFDITEKLYLPMLSTGASRRIKCMLFKHTSRKKIDILLTQMLQDLNVLELLSVMLLNYCVPQLVVQGVENTALNINPTCQYAGKEPTN